MDDRKLQGDEQRENTTPDQGAEVTPERLGSASMSEYRRLRAQMEQEKQNEAEWVHPEAGKQFPMEKLLGEVSMPQYRKLRREMQGGE